MKIKILTILIITAVTLTWAKIDQYDSSVVRSILDSNKWWQVSVESVVTVDDSSKRVKTLNLTARNDLPKITALPVENGRLPELTTLILTGNQLDSLPHKITNLRHSLSKLDLSKNNFTSLPPWLDTLYNLRILNLNRNQFTEFPYVICKLGSLQHLFLGSNQLDSLKDGIKNLTGLQLLMLDSNLLTTLPDSIVKLQNVYINVVGNKLCSIPRAGALASWIDAHSTTSGWRDKQSCPQVGFGAIFSNLELCATAELKSSYNPTINPSNPILCESYTAAVPDLPAGIRMNILKAVKITLNPVFETYDNTIQLSFCINDIDSAAVNSGSPAVFYRSDNGWDYIGNTKNSSGTQVSVTVSRQGIYVLAGTAQTAAVNSGRIAGTGLNLTCGTVSNGLVSVQFTLNTPSRITAKLFTLTGKLVGGFSEKSFGAGKHRIVFEKQRLGSGIKSSALYLLIFKLGNETIVRPARFF